ncbi:MAG: aldehyde-activating protein [Sphingobium sp.]|uniref:GFA family protein n=1 Tax=Sphingobium sp. TaxID=1912891 RepID=UPI000DB680F6|nr:GFA family protein [Sphingobium sp.]PZU12361.1 MAG: aldehyde-activating protein [Sphingobium sp.]
MVTGGCQCRAIRYEAEGEPAHSAICHCADCRASAGAPMVGWALFPQDAVTIRGTSVRYRSSQHATRHFCGTCGTGLFYTNDTIFPGSIDIQTGTLDDIEALPPQAHIQMADAPSWWTNLDRLPLFDRYPG